MSTWGVLFLFLKIVLFLFFEVCGDFACFVVSLLLFLLLLLLLLFLEEKKKKFL